MTKKNLISVQDLMLLNRDDFLLDLSNILKALRGIDNISTHKAESVIDELIEIIKKYKYEALMGEGINKKKNK